MAAIKIENVTKSYGTVTVMEHVDIAIEDGEFVVLVGPSGCGKSTLLRMIAGLEEVTEGDIHIGDRIVTHLPPKDRDIAMVFQNYALYPHMTVLENMGFSLKLAGAGAAQLREKVEPVAQTLGLSELLDRYPRQLSGGQRQRVAMGRAIVRKPSVFLFDEPLSNLDAKLRVAMRTEIKALHQRLKSTIVYVTHDQVEAMTMADKIVVLNAGTVEQVGSPLELYDDPANSFVAGFIGSPAMNFFPATIERGVAAIEGSGSIELQAPLNGHHGQKVVCGIRPDHFRLSDKGLATSVEIVEPTGSETLVHAKIGNTPATMVFKERVQKNTGENLTVEVKPEQLYFFDIQTGERIRAT